MQAVDDLGQRQSAHSCRRQLDCQRHPVEAPADFRHGRGVVVGDDEIGPGMARPVGKQFNGRVGQRQRRHPPAQLAGHTDRLTAGRQQCQSRSGAEQRNDHRRARIEQMFAVVQHHQHLALGYKPGEGVHRGAARLIGQPECAGHRDRDEIGIRNRRQVDISDSVAESARRLGGDLNRQPGFADPAGTGQRHQPVPGQ
jgi:hypothetical protein